VTAGARFKARMLTVAGVTSGASVGLVALYLLVLLHLTPDQWIGFFEVVGVWFAILLALSQRIQNQAYAPICRYLDRETAGGAGPDEARAAFAGALDVPRLTALNGLALWAAGGALVAGSMKFLFDDLRWLDAGIMVAAATSGGALSTLLIALLFKGMLEPLRGALARAVRDPAARVASVRPVPLGWKLQGAVLITAAVPIVFAAFVAQVQAARPLEDFVTRLQGEFLEAGARRWSAVGPPALDSMAEDASGSGVVADFLVLDTGLGSIVHGPADLLTADELAQVGAVPRGHAVGTRRVISWLHLPADPRVLVASLPREALASELSAVRAVFAGLLALSIALASGVAWLVSRDVVRAIGGLRGEAERIAAGDLCGESVVESEDELGELGRSFERMRSSLREIVGRVAETADGVEEAAGDMAAVGRRVSAATAEQVRGIREATEATNAVREQAGGIAASAEALGSSVEESSSSILEMGAAGEELSQAAHTLSAQVEAASEQVEEMIGGVRAMGRSVEGLWQAAAETGSSVQEMAGSMREVDANAAETARLSAQVVDAAEGGTRKVRETMTGMEAIREATATAEGVIRGLGARAEEIGAIVDVIDGVADETNLLALNAAIIAAQAGEHGRAFSVVAEEIKELADRVMASTKEIGGVIRSVQVESAAAIGAIERGSASVRVGVEQSAEAGEALFAITEAARESGARISEIVMAVQEQTRAAGHVVDLMERVRQEVEGLRRAMGEQQAGHAAVQRGTAAMRDLAQQVHRTTEEQARGGGQIRNGIEVVREVSSRIEEALREQAASCSRSAELTAEVLTRARTNGAAAERLAHTAGTLRAGARELREGLRRFKV
jgi:methyl-accepting chemotaxis protein